MKKNHQYTRELTSTQINELQSKYNPKSTKKRGFLSSKQRVVLLHKGKIGKRTSIPNESDFFYTIREKAKSAFDDYMLLLYTLTDSQLEDIFSSQSGSKNTFSILSVLNRLFELEFRPITIVDVKGKKVKTSKEPINIDDTWKALLSETILKICIEFFKNHRYISTNIHNRFLDELEEMINVEISRASQLYMHNRVKGIA